MPTDAHASDTFSFDSMLTRTHRRTRVRYQTRYLEVGYLFGMSLQTGLIEVDVIYPRSRNSWQPVFTCKRALTDRVHVFSRVNGRSAIGSHVFSLGTGPPAIPGATFELESGNVSKWRSGSLLN